MSSEAARKAYGVPWEVRRVREPVGEVDWEEAMVEAAVVDVARERSDSWEERGVAGGVEVLVD